MSGTEPSAFPVQRVTASIDTATGAVRPLLVPVVPDVGRMLGGLGKTATYDLLRRHRVPIVRVGGRSTVALTDIERVAAELIAEAKPLPAAPESQAQEPRRRRRGDELVEAPAANGAA